MLPEVSIANLDVYESLSSEYLLHHLRHAVFPEAKGEELLNLLTAAVNVPLRNTIKELAPLLENPDIKEVTTFFMKKVKQTGGRGAVAAATPVPNVATVPSTKLANTVALSPVERLLRVYTSVEDPTDSLNLLRHMLFYQHAEGLKAFIQEYEDATSEGRRATLVRLRGIIEWGAETI
jgi:hypothetical protein